MTKLWNKTWLVVAFALAGASLAMAEPTRMPRPGSLNSVQGRVTFDGHQAAPQYLRREKLRPGQVIRTQHGKAALLLTPGSFLRIGNDSEVKMLSTSLENTRAKVVKGMAILNSDATFKRGLAIIMDGTTTRIDKKGIYGFSANRQTISVLRGKATVYTSGSEITLKHKHLLYLAGQPPFEVRKLNKRAFKSTRIYQWNKLRNKYERRARRSVEQAIAQSGHWYGPGWYWSGYWGFYTYLHSQRTYMSPYYGPYGPWGPWGNNWGFWGWGDGDGD